MRAIRNARLKSGERAGRRDKFIDRKIEARGVAVDRRQAVDSPFDDNILPSQIRRQKRAQTVVRAPIRPRKSDGKTQQNRESEKRQSPLFFPAKDATRGRQSPPTTTQQPPTKTARAAAAPLDFAAGKRRRRKRRRAKTTAIQPRGRICGKATASRIEWHSASSITSRSIPMPPPPLGGIAYSIASM